MGEDSHLYNHEFAARIYDLSLKNMKAEWFLHRNQFILSLSEQYGIKILNLGCGTGELSLFLARHGCDTVGIDLSEYMLEVALKKLEKETIEVQNQLKFEQGDMVSFTFPVKFHIVTISGAVFTHLMSQEEQIECFKTIHRHLDEGGILCLDTSWPIMEKMVEHSDPKNIRKVASRSFRDEKGHEFKLFDELFYNLSTQHLKGRKVYEEFDQNGQFIKKHSIPMNLRMTFPSEMRLLFHLCGFKVVSENWGYTSKPIEYGCNIVWVVHPIKN